MNTSCHDLDFLRDGYLLRYSEDILTFWHG